MTEQQAVTALTNLLQGMPDKSCPVSRLGQLNWKYLFKPRLGSLIRFVEKHGNLFEYDEIENKISLKKQLPPQSERVNNSNEEPKQNFKKKIRRYFSQLNMYNLYGIT